MYSKIIKYIIYIFAKLIGGMFYQRKYLEGKLFSSYDTNGWKLVIRDAFMSRLTGTNKSVPWPVSFKTTIVNYKKIHFHKDDLHLFHSPGTYFQAMKGDIYIGRGSYIAPNVGLITTNHSFDDLSKHTSGQDIKIGKKCWIGMNSVILPGVVLGDKTIVGAGSVVTKSFPEGCCVIAGVPARIIKILESDVRKKWEGK